MTRSLGPIGALLVILAAWALLLLFLGFLWQLFENRKWRGTRRYDEAEAEKRLRLRGGPGAWRA